MRENRDAAILPAGWKPALLLLLTLLLLPVAAALAEGAEGAGQTFFMESGEGSSAGGDGTLRNHVLLPHSEDFPVGEDKPVQLSGNEYVIAAGGKSFRSSQTAGGPGWRYSGGTLILGGEYAGDPIAADGDLKIYAYGNVTVNGQDRGSGNAAAGIAIRGVLELYLFGERFAVTGGSTDRDADAGDGIMASEGFSCINSGKIFAVTGGSSYGGGLAGCAISSPKVLTICSKNTTIRNSDGTESFAGRADPDAKIMLTGGTGSSFSAAALSAYEVNIDADGVISGGHHSPGILCSVIRISSIPGRTMWEMPAAMSLSVRAGSPGIPALTSAGGAPDCIIGPQTQKEDLAEQGTVYEVRFSPQEMTLHIDPDGGTPGPAVRTTYPQPADLRNLGITRPGYFLYGFRSDDLSRVVHPHDTFIPYTYYMKMMAQWAPFDGNDLFIGDWAYAGDEPGSCYDDYLTRVLHRSYTVPWAKPTLNGYRQLGWSSDPDWNIDPETGFVNKDSVWLREGSENISQSARVYYSKVKELYRSVRYYGEGGFTANGSNMAAQCMVSSSDNLEFYVESNETIGFRRDGHQFSGWMYYTTFGDLVPYEVGTPLPTNTNKPHTMDVILLAQWKKDASDRMTVTGETTREYTGGDISLRDFVTVELPGGTGTYTYTLDGQETTLSHTIRDVGQHELKVRYEDGEQIGEKTITLTITDQKTLRFPIKNTAASGGQFIVALYKADGQMLEAYPAGRVGDRAEASVPLRIYRRAALMKMFQTDSTGVPAAPVSP